GTWENIGGMK
ncbi:hypothetical protein ECFDA504_1058, partial [Escherichia coli FDA504]